MHTTFICDVCCNVASVTILLVTISCVVPVSAMQRSSCTVRVMSVCRLWGFENQRYAYLPRRRTNYVRNLRWCVTDTDTDPRQSAARLSEISAHALMSKSAASSPSNHIILTNVVEFVQLEFFMAVPRCIFTWNSPEAAMFISLAHTVNYTLGSYDYTFKVPIPLFQEISFDFMSDTFWPVNACSGAMQNLQKNSTRPTNKRSLMNVSAGEFTDK